MKANFTIGEYKSIPISPEITYNDLMDGTPDSMAFAFHFHKDITDEVQLKQKCYVTIEDSIHKLYPVGTKDNNTLNILDKEYVIVNEEIFYNNESVGRIVDNVIYLTENTYVVEDNVVYKDDRKYYNMCLSQITSEKLSTVASNGYFITVLLKEQTVLLKDCVRTDLAITPSLYPQNGSDIFSNLYDATLKIVDCHNMCILNDTILSIDEDLINSLKLIPCPNLTYRDLSTYSQLYDIFMRIGRIPYYENGTLYGIKLDGETKQNIIDLSAYSHISNIKNEGINDTIYSSKIYNNVYDDEYAIVPSIFSDLVAGYENQGKIDNSGYEILDSDADLTTFMGAKTTSVIPVTASSESELSTKMKNIVNEQYSEWLSMQYSGNEDLSKTLLFVNGFNNASSGIDDARDYSIELPFGIETIDSIYLCKPRYLKWRLTETTGMVYFGWKLEKVNNYRIIENSIYSNLSSLQKRTTSYYVRGGTSIRNIIACMIPPDTEDNEELFIPTDSDLQGSYSWSTAKLYNLLRSAFFVVKYKPISNTTYTNYNYVRDLGEEKPLAINNFNLPYSQVSDKQVYPILEYNLQKGTDNTYNLKLIDTDPALLDLTAGDVVRFKDKEFIINKYQYIINNETIEGSYELNDNIIQNSILSSYRDNVRISSNISAESSVDRQVHIYGENVIRMYDTLYGDAPTNISQYKNFIQEIGQNMVNASFYKNGLFTADVYNNPLINVYGNLSKYPIRTTQIDPEDNPNVYGVNVRIDSSYGIGYTQPKNPDANQYYNYTFNDDHFPIAIVLHKHYFNNPTFETSLGLAEKRGKDVYWLKKVVNNMDEFKAEIPNLGACAIHHDLTPYVYHNALFLCNYEKTVIDGGAGGSSTTIDYDEVVDLRPDYYTGADISNPIKTWPTLDKDRINGWIAQRKFGYYENELSSDFGTKGNYVFSPALNDFVSSKYITDKLVSNSGLLTKIDYSSVDKYYSGSAYQALYLVQPDTVIPTLAFPDVGNGILVDQNPIIEQQIPARFNTSDRGCRLECFGKSKDAFYSLYTLPLYSGVGLYVDMRENIRPYIQYKTRGMNTSTYIIKELNQNYQWLSTINTFKQNSPFVSGKIYKIPKRTSINNYVASENDKICNARILSKMHTENDNDKYGNGSLTLDLSTVYLLQSDDYDYCLTMVRENGEEVNLIKFNITKEEMVAFSHLTITSTIYTNYD